MKDSSLMYSTNRQSAQMEKFKQGFSKRLNLARKRADLSLRGLASLVGTTYVSVHQWEHGTIPQDKFIIKLAEALNVEVDWLLGVNVDREIDNWLYEIINASKEKQEIIKKTWEAIKNL